MTPESRKRLRELALAATPGPWYGDMIIIGCQKQPDGRWWVIGDDAMATEDDAEYIGSVDPTSILSLLDRLDRYEEALEWYANLDLSDKYVQAVPKRARQALEHE